MDLYFSPLACSLSARIALYEAGADAKFHYVETRTHKLEDGSDFLAVNAMGMVPVLRTEDGRLLTENPVVLQHIAEAAPQSGLAPKNAAERAQIQQWLNFVTSELHKFVFVPLLDAKANEGAKAYAREKSVQRLDHLDAHLKGRDFLLDRFTVADAYLATVLNWAPFAGVDLARWPNVQAYHKAMHARPAIAKAFAEELALYQQQEMRRKAA